MNNKILYTLDTKGKTRYWKAYSDFKLNNTNKITITIEYGLLGSERFITKNRYIASGKNIGRANETTIQEQAELEIGYLYQKQLDDGYVEDIEDYVEPQRPQLAHKYNDKKHIVKWVSLKDAGVMKNLYYASRKLNGCLHEDSLILTNKGYKKLGTIVDEKLPLEVLSLDEKTLTVQFKKILNYFDNGKSNSTDWVKLKTKNKEILCTKDHKIFTSSGWKRADHLDLKSDLIFQNNQSNLNSLILGTVLGDSCFSIEKRNISNGKWVLNKKALSWRMLFSHVNEELYNFKATLFNLPFKKTKRVSGYGSPIFAYTSTALSKSNFPIQELYDVDFKSDNFGRRKVISLEYLLSNFSLDSLSLWIADDGSMRFNNGNKDTPVLSLATMGYSEEQNLIFQSMFEILFKIKPTLVLHKASKTPGYFLNFKTKDTLYILSLLKNKHCKGAEYKYYFPTEGYLELELADNFVPFEIQYFNGTENFRKLDIEVQDNHNYFANDILVHNCRCFIFMKNGKVDRFESRTGKPFKYFDHIANDLKDYKYWIDHDSAIDEVILDGELFNEDIPFEILCSLINSDEYVEVLDTETGKLWSTNDVQFHCYDIVPLTKEPLNFYDRFVDYLGLPTSSNIIRVDSEAVESEEAMVVLAKEWIKDGYEGLMLRYGNSLYDFGKRSNNLLKFKIMEDEEFKIKDIYLAENDDQKVMFVLHNHHGEKDSNYSSFDCFMKGDKEINLKYFNLKDQYINKWLTVQYQTLSKYNVPLFPVGISVREGVEENGRFIPNI